jgi:hypothetical protein
MEWKELELFRLVGGTGLSLQLGHRQSIDIDLFSDADYDFNDLAKIVRKKLEFDPIILNNSDWLTVKFSLINAFNDYINRKLK